MKKIHIFVVFCALFVFSSMSYAQMPSYKKVCGAIQDLNGWQLAEKCSGTNMSGTSVGSVVIASKRFIKQDKEIELSVFSGMQAMASWGMFKSNLSIENNENLLKTLTIQGYKGGVSYDKKEHSGVVYICIKHAGNGCMVLFALKFNNMGYKEALGIVKDYNLKNIESIF